MGFDKFGIIGFTAQSKVDEFVDHLEEGRLMGTKCKRCGALFFPPRADCYRCLGSDMEWFEVKGKGKLLSYTKAMYGPVGFEKELPYILAIVDFGDYKVFGRMSKDVPEEEIKVGMEVTPKVVKLPEERIIYEFVKA